MTLFIISIIIFAPLLVPIITHFVKVKRYYDSNYYKATQKTYDQVNSDKGLFGEYCLYETLRPFEALGAKFLFNCYIPKDQGNTTEIDLIMVCHSGIYVFENKNYSGWIFGSEDSRTWTQSLVGKGWSSQKEHFYNPVMQNNSHIAWLKKQVGENYPFHSLIVFSDHCSFMNVNITSPNVSVIQRFESYMVVSGMDSSTGKILSDEQVESIYNSLYAFTQVSEETKIKHINDILNTRTESPINNTCEPVMAVEMTNAAPMYNVVEQVDLCPWCGGRLTLRVAKKGINTGKEFYGCSNYPKCRFTKDKEIIK